MLMCKSYSAKISFLVCFGIIVSFDFWLQIVKDWKVLYYWPFCHYSLYVGLINKFVSESDTELILMDNNNKNSE